MLAPSLLAPMLAGCAGLLIERPTPARPGETAPRLLRAAPIDLRGCPEEAPVSAGLVRELGLVVSGCDSPFAFVVHADGRVTKLSPKNGYGGPGEVLVWDYMAWVRSGSYPIEVLGDGLQRHTLPHAHTLLGIAPDGAIYVSEHPRRLRGVWMRLWIGGDRKPEPYWTVENWPLAYQQARAVVSEKWLWLHAGRRVEVRDNLNGRLLGEPRPPGAVAADPAFDGQVIFAPVLDGVGRLYVYSVHARGEGTALASPHGTLRALGSPAVAADGTVYFSATGHVRDPHSGRLVEGSALAALGEEWKPKWTVLGPRPENEIFIARDGTVLALGRHTVYALRPDGSIRWKLRLTKNAAVPRDRFLALMPDGTLYVLRPSTREVLTFATGLTGSTPPKWAGNYRPGRGNALGPAQTQETKRSIERYRKLQRKAIEDAEAARVERAEAGRRAEAEERLRRERAAREQAERRRRERMEAERRRIESEREAERRRAEAQREMERQRALAEKEAERLKSCLASAEPNARQSCEESCGQKVGVTSCVFGLRACLIKAGDREQSQKLCANLHRRCLVEAGLDADVFERCIASCAKAKAIEQCAGGAR